MISVAGNAKNVDNHLSQTRTPANPTTTTSYRWARMHEWTPCDQICQGKQERRVVCYSLTSTTSSDTIVKQEKEVAVHDEYCRGLRRPPTEATACNLDCELEWHVSKGEAGSCSSKCGLGVRKQAVHCIKRPVDVQRHAQVVKAIECENHLNVQRPPETVSCMGGDCPPAVTTSYRWRLSEWTHCSPEAPERGCGDGNQTREVQCIAVTAEASQVISETLAASMEECVAFLKESVPATLRSCPRCPKWSVGEWSEVCLLFYNLIFD